MSLLDRAMRGAAALVLVLIVGAVVVFPGGMVAVEALGASGVLEAATPQAVRPLATSLAWAAGIGAISTMLAWPVAWRIHDRPGLRLAAALAPLIAPGYLAYVGLGLLRAPGTVLGDYLLSQGGAWPMAANRVLAALSLSLWAWPVSCLALCLALRRVDPWIWEALRLEPASMLVRMRMRLACARAGVVMGVVFTALLMLGTAIPLHLSQIPTYSIELWAALASTARDDQWRVFASAWPMVVVAFGGAGIVLARLSIWASRSSFEPGPRRRGGWLAVGVGVGVSVVLPLVLLVLDDLTGAWGHMTRFAKLHAGAIEDSGMVSLVVFGACVVIGLAAGVLEHCAKGRSWIAWGATGLLLVTALSPGVLIGSALLRAYGSAPWLRPVLDWQGAAALGCVARFGFIPALTAIWLVRTTAPELASMRRVDGADTPRGWVGAGFRAGPVVGAAVLCAAMSLHEVEASVMLDPPGVSSLATVMLGLLHYSRLQDLTAGMLLMLAGAMAMWVVLAVIGGFTGFRANRGAASPIR